MSVRLVCVAHAGAGASSFARYLLPLLRADLELSKTFEHEPHPRLDCPVTAFIGAQDPVVAVSEVRSWAFLTDGRFRTYTFPGDHFFHQTNRRAVAAVLTETLLAEED